MGKLLVCWFFRKEIFWMDDFIVDYFQVEFSSEFVGLEIQESHSKTAIFAQ